MQWNNHSKLNGLHAFLSASKYHWLGYEDSKMIQSYHNWKAAQEGTRLHALAKELISLGIRLEKTDQTLNRYVNDCIGFRMKPEQPLFYSDNCFGTADAISFRENKLRIFDLKTGTTTAKMYQLYIYAALFCLEYNYIPSEIEVELRIYQNDDVQIEEPDPQIIRDVIEKIKHADNLIHDLRQKEGDN